MAETGFASEAIERDGASGLLRVPFKALLADPHGMFRAARPQGPLIVFRTGGLLAIRAADVVPLLTDPRVRQVGTEGLALAGITAGPFHRFASHTMLLSHGAAHARRRRPAARAFHFSLMEKLRPAIRAAADELLEEIRAGLPADGTFDLRDRFASILPARIIARILGLAEAEIPDFTRLVYAMSPGLSFGLKPEEWPAVDAASAGLFAYCERLLAERRVAPRDDFLTDYLRLVDDSGDLDADETLMQVVSLVLAGADTTRGALTILASLLLATGDWAAVAADPALAPGAVAESLRFEPSVGSVAVVPLEPVAVGGITVPPGLPVGLSTLSAMRDPDLYADPDRFDIRRTDHPRLHLVFGGGPHRCLGEALARAEMEEGLRALAAAMPGLRLAGRPARMTGVGGIRQVSALPVAAG